MMKSLSALNLPRNCWIHKNKRYILSDQILHELPYVPLEYERILKAHDIPYRKITVSFYRDETEELLEFWNPEVGFEEEDLTLPLYAESSDSSYYFCQKNHTEKVPTAKCLKAAEETEVFIQRKIHEYNQILGEVSHYTFAKEKLAGGVVTVCSSNVTPYVPFYDIEMNNDHFKLFRIPDVFNSVSDWVVIFNMNKVAPNGYLTIQVPKSIAGFAIGKNGCNLHLWEEILRVKKISVIPIKE